MIKQFLTDEEGQTLVEYGLLMSLIALMAVAGVTIFGRGMRDIMYGNIDNATNAAMAPVSP